VPEVRVFHAPQASRNAGFRCSFGDEQAYQKSAGAGQVTWLSVLAHPGK